MRSFLKGEYYDSGFLISAVLAWIICASMLLLICTVLLCELGCTEQALGYTSSAISFLAAFTSGVVASRRRKSGTIYTALMTAAVIVTTLLTIGFLINGSAIEPSAIMSVVSFTFAGCMSGAILFFSPGKRHKQYKPRI